MTQDALTDAETLKYYEDTQATYLASGPGGANRNLGSFLDRLQDGARVLDLGCGGGIDSAEMIRRGFDVVPVDGARSVAQQAEARIGRPVLVQTFEELAFEQEFDAVWASASLLHVPKSALPAILSKVRAALRPGGLHFASYKAGLSDARDPDNRYYNYPTVEELVSAYDGSGEWRLLDIVEYIGGGFGDGGKGPWIAVIAAREDRGTPLA
jgi:SAM-dependent methyltransferase